MPIEINVVQGRATAGKYPVIAENLLSCDFSSGWASVGLSGNGIAPVISGTSNELVTCEVSPGGVNSRSMLQKGETLPVGHYVFMVQCTALTGTIDAHTVSISPGTALVGSYVPGQQSVTTTGTGTSGWYAITFEVTSEGSVNFRLGLAPNTATQNSAAAITFSNPCIFGPYNQATPNDEIPLFAYKLNQSALLQGMAAFPFANNGAQNITTGNVTFPRGAPLNWKQAQKFSVGLFVGDSYWNETADAVAEIVKQDGHLILYGAANGGEDSGQFEARLADVLSMTGYIKSDKMIKPEFIFIPGTVNDINSSRTADQIVQSYENMFDAAIAAQVYPIYITTTLVKTFLYAELDKFWEVAHRMRALCAAKGAGYIDTLSDLQDPSDPSRILPAYELGDEIHLTQGTGGGYERYGQSVSRQLREIRRGSVSPAKGSAINSPIT